MLANLLPGLRDLRAPLTAGYVWLLADYLAFAPLVPAKARATGIWHSLDQLRVTIGPVGAGVALSVTAYLLGAISQGLFSNNGLRQQLLRRYHRALFRHDRLRSLLVSVTPQRYKEQVRHPFSRYPNKTIIRHGVRGRRALSAAVTTRTERIQTLLAGADLSLHALAFTVREVRLKMPLASANRSLRPLASLYVIDSGLLGSDEPPADRDEIEEWDEYALLEGLETMIRIEAAGELDLARTGLLGSEKALFEEVDRLQAEGELRGALSPAMLGLAATLAWRATWWSAAVLVFATGILAFQGRQRSRLATDSVLEALRIGRTKVPVLDQIDDAITKCEIALRRRAAS
jgi:hypothetical protein